MGRRIVCFGDSNTYGYDPRAYLGGRYPSSVRWTALLENAGWEAVNAGVNGRRIPRQTREAIALCQTLRQMDAEALVVMLGTNDLLQPASRADACAERMARFLTAFLKDAPPSCKVLLVSPPPMQSGAWVNAPEILEESRRLAGCYKTLARKLGLFFADAGDWRVALAFDGVHFSAAGHRAFAAGMLEALKQLPLPEKV